MNLEIACFNLRSAITAQQAGADRIELCEGLELGGITPSKKLIKEARRLLYIPLVVMIRPRGGNFVYTQKEFEEMKSSIAFCKANNIDGVVFGILNENYTIDINRNKELIRLASPMKCTFHRAFDEIKDKSKTLEDVIDCGFRTILTSGGEAPAKQGIRQLKELYSQAGHRIEIMPGGGVRSDNIDFLIRELNTAWYHSSAIIDNSGIANDEEVQAIKQALKK